MKRSASAPSLINLQKVRPIHKSISCQAISEQASFLVSHIPVTQIYQCFQAPQVHPEDLAICLSTPQEPLDNDKHPVYISKRVDLNRYQVWYDRMRRKKIKSLSNI